jgi:hypothetical protein
MNDDDISRARDRPDLTSTAPVAATMNDDDILRAWSGLWLLLLLLLL